MTTHDTYAERYRGEPWIPPEDRTTGPTPSPDLDAENETPTLAEVLQRLSEARAALKLSHDLITEIEQSLGGLTT